jgi:hypothetical protein
MATKPKLHEFLAVLSGKKGEIAKVISEIYKQIQKPDLYDGLRRTYQPAKAVESGGELLPPENKPARENLKDHIAKAVSGWRELIDLVATVDAGNQQAKADLVIGGRTIDKDVPVTTLLFLEKQLTDVRTFIDTLPTPDTAETWIRDPVSGMLVTEPTQTRRTEKVQRPIVLFPATPEHPAQTQLITEDVTAGTWTAVKSTTKVTRPAKEAALARVDALLAEVKMARERANSISVESRKTGELIMKEVFDGLLLAD